MKEHLFHHKDFYEHKHFTNLHSCRQQVFSWISLPPCAFSFLFLFPAKKKRLLKPWCRAELSTHICNSRKHFNEPIIFDKNVGQSNAGKCTRVYINGTSYFRNYSYNIKMTIVFKSTHNHLK